MHAHKGMDTPSDASGCGLDSGGCEQAGGMERPAGCRVWRGTEAAYKCPLVFLAVGGRGKEEQEGVASVFVRASLSALSSLERVNRPGSQKVEEWQ